MRPAAPRPPHRPPAAPRYMRELAHVGEIDLLEGLGPQRHAALAQLGRRTEGRPRRRRWLLATGLAVLGLAAAVLALGRS